MLASMNSGLETDDATIVRTTIDQLTTLLRTGFPCTDGELDALYNIGVQIYQQGKWEDASRIFGLVNMFAPFNPLYLTAQGKCLKCLCAYEDAHDVFHLAWTIDRSMRAAALHAAECLMLAGRKVDAVALLNEVLAAPEMSNNNVELRGKAEAWIALLSAGEIDV